MTATASQLGQSAVEDATPDTDDLQLWSVTTLIGAVEKPALLYWSAEQTALAAIHADRTWRGMLADDDPACKHTDAAECAAVKWLRDARFRRPKGFRSATELGTLVHDACEQYALTGTRPDVDDEVRPFVEQFDGWLQRFSPTYQATEVAVYHPELGYAGTADAFLSIDGTRFVADYKGLDRSTPLPTPDGWTTVAGVEVGDYVLGRDGHPTVVTEKSDVHMRTCYRVTFDDASTVVCDDEHQWRVVDTTTRSALAPEHRAPAVLRTDQLARWLRHKVTGQRRLAVPVSEPINLPPRDLPVDPYVYGCWLGDGSRSDGRITAATSDHGLFDLIRARGYYVGAPIGAQGVACTIYGLGRQLRLAGLIGHRVIPDAYLRGSVAQRVDLLRGLMDTDGSWTATRAQAVFSTVNKATAAAVVDLVAGLGERPLLNTNDAHGFGLDVTAYQVTWRPQRFNPFALPRKADRVLVGASAKSWRRLIVSAEKTITVPTQCLTVDAADACFLAGPQMIPTHNSTRRHLDGRGKPTTPYPEQVALQLAAYRWARYAAVWRPRRMEKFRRRYYLLGPGERAMAQPVPEVDTGLVIHITPDGCEAYPMVCDQAVFEAYLAVQDTARWLYQDSHTAMGDPLTHDQTKRPTP